MPRDIQLGSLSTSFKFTAAKKIAGGNSQATGTYYTERNIPQKTGFGTRVSTAAVTITVNAGPGYSAADIQLLVAGALSAFTVPAVNRLFNGGLPNNETYENGSPQVTQ